MANETIIESNIVTKEQRTLSEKKREAIVLSAISEFGEHGFQKTSMDQIAATAHVSKRTVYNHFPSKELLFKEIIDQIQAKGAAATAFEYHTTQSLAQQLTTIAEQELTLLQSQSFVSLSRMVIAECMHSPELAKKALTDIEQSDSGLKLWLAKAVADNRLVIDDIDFSCNQFFGLLKSFAFWPQVIGYGEYPSSAQCKKIIDSAVAMFLKQYQK